MYDADLLEKDKRRMSVQKIKRLLLLMMVVGLTAGVLAGCANPKDTTEKFLTAIQKGDVEKARTFVESDKEFNKLNEKQMMLRQKQC